MAVVAAVFLAVCYEAVARGMGAFFLFLLGHDMLPSGPHGLQKGATNLGERRSGDLRTLCEQSPHLTHIGPTNGAFRLHQMHPSRAGVALKGAHAALPAALHILIRIVGRLAVDHRAEMQARTFGVRTMSRAKIRH